AGGGTIDIGNNMTFQGSGNDSFSSDLHLDDEGGITFARTGGTTTITPGARIISNFADEYVILGGTRDVLSDGTNYVDFAGASDITINAGPGKNVGSVDTSPTNANTTALVGAVTANAPLTATHIRKNSLSGNTDITIRPSSLAIGVSN